MSSPRAASNRRLARALFDLEPDRPEPVPGAAAGALAIDRALQPGGIALITGPSGGGKTTILHHLRTILRARGHTVVVVNPERVPARRVVDAFDAPLPTTLSFLAACGLADASILERCPHELSTGQRWRLALALALRRAQRRAPHSTLLIDELGSSLDRTAARCLCRTLRRWVEPRPIRAVCAAHDDSLIEFLAPAVLALQPLGAPCSVQVRPRRRSGA